jgi:hypothetical protein
MRFLAEPQDDRQGSPRLLMATGGFALWTSSCDSFEAAARLGIGTGVWDWKHSKQRAGRPRSSFESPGCKVQKSPLIERLPNQVLISILERLTDEEIHASVSLVSKRWRDLAAHEVCHFETLFLRLF